MLQAIAAAAVLLSWFHSPTLAANLAANFGVGPSEISRARPGTVLRIWPLEGGVRPGYKGYRILYRSTGLKNEAILVTGALIFPESGDGESERPVVAWAHPTSGVVTRCAPTLMPGLAGTIQGLDALLDKGYVIVATDYPGLGAPGDHPYLVGASEARAVLDSVRAARFIKNAQAGNAFVVWGHSQGGHAALFTAHEAPAYAPELKLLGVAAAAPATKLMELFEADRDTSSGRSITAMALYAWSRVYGFPLSRFVVADAEQPFIKLAGNCIQTLADFQKIDKDEHALMRNFLVGDALKDPRIGAIFKENTPGLMPAGLPVFLSQARGDTLVRPDVTRAYAKELCDGGARVKLVMLKGGSHIITARDSAYAAATWMARLFDGRAPPNDC
jgi:pimeloyl-ACP methyl ester carboxylesterase